MMKTEGMPCPACEGEARRTSGSTESSIKTTRAHSEIDNKESEARPDADPREWYQKREAAVEQIVDAETLWQALLLFQGYEFHTITGLKFSYEIRKGRNGTYTKELWIDRRGESKSLTMSTVLKAYENRAGAGIVERPKALGDLRGVSYIYPIFFRFGLIEVPEKVKGILNGKKSRR